MKDITAKQDDTQLRFGTIAVQLGYITTEDIIEAMRIQITEDIEKREHRKIGQILLEQKLISPSQIDEVMREVVLDLKGDEFDNTDDDREITS